MSVQLAHSSAICQPHTGNKWFYTCSFTKSNGKPHMLDSLSALKCRISITEFVLAIRFGLQHLLDVGFYCSK